MAFKFNKITIAIKKQIIKTKSARMSSGGGYQKLERSPSQEEIDNTANERLERKIREGLARGTIMLVIPPQPVCAHCKKRIQL